MDTDTPKYLRMANEFIELIKQDILRQGDRLPSLRSVSKSKMVSINTVRKAYDELYFRGFAYSIPKQGVFACKNYYEISQTPLFEQEESFNFNEIFNDSNPNRIKLDLGTLSNLLLPQNTLIGAYKKLRIKDCLPTYRPTNSQGNIGLRNLLCKHFMLRGIQIGTDDIHITSGCLNAISIAIQACTQPKQTIGVVFPAYPPYSYLINGLDRNIYPLNFTDETELVNNIEKACSNNSISAFIIQSLAHNPTGKSLSRKSRKRIAEISNEHNIPIIEDDIHGDQIFDEQNALPITAFDANNALICGSFTKSISPNERIGWCIPGKYKKIFVERFYTNSASVNELSQEAMRRYLVKNDYTKLTAQLSTTLSTLIEDYIEAILSSFPDGTRVEFPSGGCFLWIEMENCYALSLWRKAKENNIDIIPGSAYSLNKDYNKYIRISVREPLRQDIETAIKTLGTLAKELDGKPPAGTHKSH